MKKWLRLRWLPVGLAALTVLVATALGEETSHRPLTDPHGPCYLARNTQQRYSWQGSCSVTCDQTGQCRVVFNSGFVYAKDAATARVLAEGVLRSWAGGQGKLVEGSINVSVSIRF